MPTYDYKCERCDHTFEAFQSITAAPLKKCPKCGKPKLRRLIGTGAALLFKGDGFYITDYRSENYKNAAKAETGSGDGKSGETKPADGKPADARPADARPAAEAKPAANSAKAEPKRSAAKSTRKRQK